MPLIHGASGVVIRCFKSVERCADAFTGAAGPVFIFLAWLLTGAIGFTFFDVIARDISWLWTLILLPIYILVPLNMYVQYYLVTHIRGGYPGCTDPRESRWIEPNPQGLLAPERWGFHRCGASTQPPVPPRVRRCRKCDGPKPERTHHCSVCNRCVLLMDHHCPWINTCVGLHNQRHFVLFMMWLSFGTLVFVLLGYNHFWESLNFYDDGWNAWSPRILFTLSFILSLACGLAVFVLGSWHLYMVAKGETSIEQYDNGFMTKKAKEEGLIYLNPFDLGRRRNLENFFNIGPTGYSRLTLLFPLVVPPYTDGWSYPRRALPFDMNPDPAAAPLLHAEDRQGPGVEWMAHDHMDPAAGERLVGDGPGGRYVMGGTDDLTDDEDGGGGWWGEPNYGFPPGHPHGNDYRNGQPQPVPEARAGL